MLMSERQWRVLSLLERLNRGEVTVGEVAASQEGLQEQHRAPPRPRHRHPEAAQLEVRDLRGKGRRGETPALG